MNVIATDVTLIINDVAVIVRQGLVQVGGVNNGG
jgi:hypothetical protein